MIWYPIWSVDGLSTYTRGRELMSPSFYNIIYYGFSCNTYLSVIKVSPWHLINLAVLKGEHLATP